ncbi:hypothetical protein GBA52_027878 [Prunus armeniaca]|nr:hypothetical protein GBA52_027878 [Prunus armeniaca]
MVVVEMVVKEVVGVVMKVELVRIAIVEVVEVEEEEVVVVVPMLQSVVDTTVYEPPGLLFRERNVRAFQREAYLPLKSFRLEVAVEVERRTKSRYLMEAQIQESVPCRPQVKAKFQLGSETYSVNRNTGILSEQVVSVKEESMNILKDFITRHNVPNDVTDELVENSSEDDGEIPEKPPVKLKKTKFT